MTERILVTGAMGQIGTELVRTLRERFGSMNVIATDVRGEERKDALGDGPWRKLDILDLPAMAEVVREFGVKQVYHLAAILSAVGERDPVAAWNVNMNGLFHVLEVARAEGCALFVPSSIAAFGPTTPRVDTPQETIQRPTSMYGVTKVAGELLCDYYVRKFGVDVRGLRYPGIISHLTPPGGGTTDYAVEIYYEAVRIGSYSCFLREGTRLDMMYMPDAIDAAIDLMAADPNRLRYRNAYNVSAMSVAPEDIAAEIAKHVSGFEIAYHVDPNRQAIADSWPDSLDDTAAREDWGWSPKYDLQAMTTDMLAALRVRKEKGRL